MLESSALQRSPRPRAVLRMLLVLLKPFAARVAVIASLAVLTALLSALEPLVMKGFFDELAGAARLRVAAGLVVVFVGLVLVRELIVGGLDVLVWRVRIGVNYAMLERAVHGLHAQSLTRHRHQSVGERMSKLERGMTGVVSAFSDVAFHLVPSIVYLVVSCVVMVRIEWRLSLVVIAFAPVPAALGAWAAREQTARERVLMDRWTALFGRLHEVLGGIAVVKSFVMEEHEKRRFLGGVRDANAIVVRGVARDAKISGAKSVFMGLARALAIALGGALVLRHEISLGTLIAFLGYVGGVFAPVQSLTGTYQTVRKGVVSLEAYEAVLEDDDEPVLAHAVRDAGSLRGEVAFEHVSFTYEGGAKALDDVSFHARPGEMIALVGPSGSGKSTALSLLLRLYDPTSGRIVVDGHDVRTLEARSLRRQIGVVLQEGVLFSDTVRDNIAFGRPGASFEEIERAARAANAHEFISALPLGYDTSVGERGCKLSGGERQRVAIARALLKEAPVLVLDEATSALDAESEEKVKEALERLTRGRTTLVIAHRLATITRADRILVFRAGRIVEQGTHVELVRAGGYYASLVQKQTHGLLVPAAAA